MDEEISFDREIGWASWDPRLGLGLGEVTVGLWDGEKMGKKVGELVVGVERVDRFVLFTHCWVNC